MLTPLTNDKRLPSDIEDGIDKFVAHLCQSYLKRCKEGFTQLGWVEKAEAIEQQRKRYEIEVRRETAHIWEHRGQKCSVALIVLGDGLIAKAKPASYAINGKVVTAKDYFERGDILKSATWKAPAKNFSRGNVTTDTAFPRWHWNGWI